MALFISFTHRVVELILAIFKTFIDKEFIEVVLDMEGQLHFSGSFLRCTLKVTHFAALHASFV